VTRLRATWAIIAVALSDRCRQRDAEFLSNLSQISGLEPVVGVEVLMISS
jgi:hypothetical protein